MVGRILDALASVYGRLSTWAGTLSAPSLAVIGVLVMAGVGAGGFYAFQTYDYVQHDNDFCMSCHLMQEPYDRFGVSAHQGLGCKACHQPTLIARSQMALTQIVENPGEVSVHAEVPNERCAHCHIEGDPEKWRLIANSAGHKVHLESKQRALRGLQCVECHATSVHEFAAIDRTCAQAGCHDDRIIQLGGMSDLTIHCIVCHNFLAPLSDGEGREGIDAAILADKEECLSCHAMRSRVHFPDPDPHRGDCGACHNPHVQNEPRDAGQSCTKSGCHTSVDTLTGFHRGLPPGILEDCVYCHGAHDFVAAGSECLACHKGVLDDILTVPRPEHSEGDTARARVGAMGEGSDVTTGTGPLSNVLFAGVGVGWWTHVPQVQTRFLHSEHRYVACTKCHASSPEHGSLLIRSSQDCRGCHHTGPLSRACERCHDEGDAPAGLFTAVRPVTLSVGRPGERTMGFRHAPHEGVGCGSCHAQGLERSAAAADCSGCHRDHHDPENDCTACHPAPPKSAHPPAKGHATCSGSGCHATVPFSGVPRTRQVCLACHRDRKDHRPGRRCAECHVLASVGG